jgi:hypothetical protein
MNFKKIKIILFSILWIKQYFLEKNNRESNINEINENIYI